jgi:hypothetical protein
VKRNKGFHLERGERDWSDMPAVQGHQVGEPYV